MEAMRRSFVDLVVSVSADGGRTWSAPRTIADEGANFIGNPAAVVGRGPVESSLRAAGTA